MKYRRLGKSGLLLSELSLGLWHNFGRDDSFSEARAMILSAFDSGITVFDLANNYGPPPGAAEKVFGRILHHDLENQRNKMVITSKAGYTMWEGPYGDWGSRKYLISSCDESLERMGLKYVDIFYSHRYDPNTPLEETMGALDYIVRSGRALYAGLSNYPADKLREAKAILDSLGTPCVVDQLKYSMFVRKPEEAHFDTHKEIGIGCVSFSPLAQGQLTNRYAEGIPADSRAARENSFLKVSEVENNYLRVQELAKIAYDRGESLAQMALAWQLQPHRTDGSGGDRITSVIIGASSVKQLTDNLGALESAPFSAEELTAIDKITL
ncbi:MAG: aldo/keto reductase [Rikenellaceae bacterium]